MAGKMELIHRISKKDFKISYFSGRGAGGQHRNKHQNCVRLQHIESGITKTGQSSRSRIDNLREAFRGITSSAEFKLWHTKKINEILGEKSLEEKVDSMMKDVKIEILKDGVWSEER